MDVYSQIYSLYLLSKSTLFFTEDQSNESISYDCISLGQKREAGGFPILQQLFKKKKKMAVRYSTPKGWRRSNPCMRQGGNTNDKH